MNTGNTAGNRTIDEQECLVEKLLQCTPTGIYILFTVVRFCMEKKKLTSAAAPNTADR